MYQNPQNQNQQPHRKNTRKQREEIKALPTKDK
jgi:hypothetical protein